jgi:hypothetical protein
MFRYTFALTICLGLLMGCSQQKPTTGKTPDSTPPEQTAMTVGDFQLQEPIQAGSVSIIPVSMTKDQIQRDGDFMTLSEAKKLGLVEITELGEGDVNALRVENKGTRSLLLLGGDLLLGGKQDRIVARDVIVPPGKTMNIEVYCVEHGRWDGQSEHFEYKEAVVPNKVREAAAFEGQQEVWGEVDKYNDANGVSQGSLPVMKGMDSGKVKQALSDGVPKVLDKLKDQKNVVGFIYILNGEVQSADLFGNSRIFDAAKESLLKSYLSDGAAHPADSTAKVDMDACKKFMEEVIEGRKARARNSALNESVRYQGRETRGAEVMAGSTRDSAGFVHGSYAPSKKR